LPTAPGVAKPRAGKRIPLLKKTPLDPLMPLVTEVVAEILSAGNVVAPLDVLLRLEIVDKDQVETWRRGGLAYLERAITSGLSRVSRVLRLVREHCAGH